MKRFYREVSVCAADDGTRAGTGTGTGTGAADAPGWRVLLDGRPIRTQGGAPQIVPTRPLAEALAGEWRDQSETIDPRAFPLRDLADYALDQVGPARAAVIARLLAYAETDTLAYRADPDEPLFKRQQELWEPLVTACEAACGIRLERVSGIVHRPQPAATITALWARLERYDTFALAGLATLASLSASLVAALAVAERRAEIDTAFAAANLEEDWQAAQWGWDHEALAVRETRAAAFRLTARFIRLARPA